MARLARAHEACSFAPSDRPVGAIVDDFARTLRESLSATLLVLTASTPEGPVLGAFPADAHHIDWVDALQAQYLAAAPTAVALFPLAGHDPRPMSTVARAPACVVALRLSGERVDGTLWVGLEDSREAVGDQLASFAVLGAHATLALERAVAARRSAPPPSREVTARGAETDGPETEELIALVAHELRTPLTPLTMLLHSIERKFKSGIPDAEAVGRARRQVERLAQMVADLLDLSRLRRNMLALSAETIELREAIRQAAQSFRERHPTHTVELQLAAEPLFVTTDEKRLERSLLSLLDHITRVSPASNTFTLEVMRHHEEGVVTFRGRQERASGPATRLDPSDTVATPPESSRARANQLKALAVHLAESLLRRQGARITMDYGPQADVLIVATFPRSPPPPTD